MTDLANESLDILRDHIRIRVAAGYATPEKITEDALDQLDDLAGELTVPAPGRLVARLLDEELEAHRTARAQWPAVTDNDRLTTAFADLNAGGIVARENFTCCGNCGVTEIWQEMREHGDSTRGYVFFHAQDTERAVAGQGLFLNFGSVGGAELDTIAVATEIMDTLHRHGLTTAWNGQVSTRIFVDLDWRRRRQSR